MEKNWTYKKIGEVCTVERGGSPRPINKFITEDDHGINWIKIGDTDDSMYITKTKQKIIPEGMKKSRYVKPGDFLLSNSMSFGRPYILKIDGCIHDGWLVLRDKEELFDKRFLYYYLSSPTTYQKFKQLAVGGVVNNLNSTMVRNVMIPVIPKDEQTSIAERLDIVKEMIVNRKEQLEELDNLIKSRFDEMFGDPVLNPKKWEQTTLKEVAIGKLSYGSGASATDFDGETRYVRITDITESGELTLDCKSPDKYEDKYILNDGDILFARSGATVGKTFRYDESKHGKCLYAGYLIKLVPDNSRVMSDYIFQYTKTGYYSSFVEKAQRAVAQPNINAKEYGDLVICVPPVTLQREFMVFVQHVDKLKSEGQKSLAETKLLFDSLMQEYFD